VGQGETHGAPPSRRPDPYPTVPLPTVSTLCTVPPTPRLWRRREGARQTKQCVDQHRVGQPEPPLSHHRAPVTSRPLPFLVLQSHLPLMPCHHPGPGSTGSRSPAIATAAPPWGSAAPLRPRPCPNRTTAPATDPGAGQGAWSRVRAAAVGPEHGARHSFLWPPSEAARRTSVGQSPTHHPSCDSPPPSPRRHHHRCLASLRGPLPLGHRRRRRRPWYTSPSPAPGDKPGDGTPTPPVSICIVRKFFQNYNPDKSGKIPTPG
jgi:hypothetical protein